MGDAYRIIDTRGVNLRGEKNRRKSRAPSSRLLCIKSSCVGILDQVHVVDGQPCLLVTRKLRNLRCSNRSRCATTARRAPRIRAAEKRRGSSSVIGRNSNDFSPDLYSWNVFSPRSKLRYEYQLLTHLMTIDHICRIPRWSRPS